MIGWFALLVVRQAAVGMNVIVVMVTGFVVFWYMGKQYWQYEPNSVKV